MLGAIHCPYLGIAGIICWKDVELGGAIVVLVQT